MADDDVQYVTSDDLRALAQLVRHHSDPSSSGYPAFLEPEPTTRRGRFGRVKEDPVEYSASFHAADPDRGGLGVLFAAPDGYVDVARAGVAVPEGWAEDPAMPGYLVAAVPPDPEATARWFLEVLVALGAPTPTGRWRCWCPELPSTFYQL